MIRNKQSFVYFLYVLKTKTVQIYSYVLNSPHPPSQLPSFLLFPGELFSIYKYSCSTWNVSGRNCRRTPQWHIPHCVSCALVVARLPNIPTFLSLFFYIWAWLSHKIHARTKKNKRGAERKVCDKRNSISAQKTNFGNFFFVIDENL